MRRVVKSSVIAAAIVLVGVGAVMAQALTTHEVRQGKVLHVYGNNLVVKMDDGTVREFDVQEGFMFDINGTPTPVTGLKPGTVLTANITTTQTPYEVRTEEVRRGTVVRKVGQTLIIRREDGTIARFNGVPDDVVLTSGGREITAFDLREGMKVTATIVHTGMENVTEREIEVAGTAPAPRPAPRRAAAPTAPAAAPAMLPSTGSRLPLVGLTGLLLIGLAVGIGVLRRF